MPQVVIVAIGLVMAYCAWSQAYWWRTVEDCSFGWLTPLLVMFVAYSRRRELTSCWIVLTKSDASSSNSVVSGMLWTGVVTGILCFSLGAVIYHGVGPTFKGTALTTAGTSLLTLTLPGVSLRRSDQSFSSPVDGDPRLELFPLLLYPALVWWISIPQLSVVSNEISIHVLGPISSIVASVFTVAGFPIFRSGNVLILPSGDRVGVLEACSGIRSFLSCIDISAFLGAVFLRSLAEKILLAGIAVIVAIILNFFRLLTLTAIAYAHGSEAIDGPIHDIAGWVEMVMTLIFLLCLLKLLQRRPR